MGVRENKVEKYLDDEIKKLGGLTRKWVSPGRDGVPDRIVIVSTTVAEKIKKLQQLDPDTLISDIHFTEVKTDDGDVTDCQAREHNRLIDCGASVSVVFGESGVDQFIETLR